MTLTYQNARRIAGLLALAMFYVARGAWHPVLDVAATAVALPLLWFVGYGSRPFFRALVNFVAVLAAIDVVWTAGGEGGGWATFFAGLAVGAAVFVAFPFSQLRLERRPGGLSGSRAF